MIVTEYEYIPSFVQPADKDAFYAERARLKAEIESIIAHDNDVVRAAVPNFIPDPPAEQTWKLPFASGDWAHRFKSGKIIMHPYSTGKISAMSGILTYFTVEEWYQPWHTARSGYYCAVVRRRTVRRRTLRLSLSPMLKWDRKVHDDARNAAFADAHSGALDIAVQLAELPETLMLYRNLDQTVKALRRTNHALKVLEQRHIKATDRLAGLQNKFVPDERLAKHARQVANAEAYIKKLEKQKSVSKQLNPFRQGSTAALMVDVWMLWRFAIRPNILSAQALMDDIAKKRRRYASYRAPRSVSNVFRDEYTRDFVHLTRIDRVTQKVDATVRIQGHKPFGSQVQQLTFNVPLAIWERIPYSWAIDRFIHIGNVLSGLHQPENLASSLGCVSAKLNVDSALIWTPAPPPDREVSVALPYGVREWPDKWTGTARTRVLLPQGTKLAGEAELFERDVVHGPTLPTLNYSTWHLAKAADLVGLATQLLRRK